MPEDLNALDRELTELLAVQPSPEFAAKVRGHLEQQPSTALAWRWWLGGAVAAAAVIALAVAIVGEGRRVQPPMPIHTDVRLSAPVQSTLPKSSAPSAATTTPKLTPRALPVRGPIETKAETLFDPSLAAAVRRLTSEQRVLPAMPAGASLDPVVVDPLEVPEIADNGAKQGDRQ
jgi:hypothetical protein